MHLCLVEKSKPKQYIMSSMIFKLWYFYVIVLEMEVSYLIIILIVDIYYYYLIFINIYLHFIIKSYHC